VLVGAQKCPSCGAPVAAKAGVGPKIIVGVVALIVLAAGALAGVYFGKPDLLPAALRGAIDNVLGKSAEPETPVPGAAETATQVPGEGQQPETGTTGETDSARDLTIPGLDSLEMPAVPEIKFDTPTVPAPDAGTDKIEGDDL
jgi:hypothetical protein